MNFLASQFLASLDAARANGGGTVTLSPGTYDLGTSQLNLTGIDNLTLEGNGATLLVTTPPGKAAYDPKLGVIHADNPNNLTIKNLTIIGTSTDPKTKLGRYGVSIQAVGDTGKSGGIVLDNCRFHGLKYGVIVAGVGAHKISRVSIRDCYAELCMHAVSFSDHGDDVRIDGLYARDCGRTYFACGVANHRLEATIDHDGAVPLWWSPVLFKCYTRDSAGLTADLTIKGGGGQYAEVVSLEHQRLETAKPTTISDVEIAVRFLVPRKSVQVLSFAAFRDVAGGPSKPAKKTTDQWKRITVKGFIEAGADPIGYGVLESRPFVDNRLIVK